MALCDQDTELTGRGDGALVVIPPAVPAWRVIDPLPERLRSLIRRHNRVFRDPARIQLRAAFHMGPVHHDNHGYIGTDVDVLFRLLDAAALKRALASSGAELGLITASHVHHNVVRRHPSLIAPTAAFQKARVHIKHTNTRMDIPARP